MPIRKVTSRAADQIGRVVMLPRRATLSFPLSTYLMLRQVASHPGAAPAQPVQVSVAVTPSLRKTPVSAVDLVREIEAVVAACGGTGRFAVT